VKKPVVLAIAFVALLAVAGIPHPVGAQSARHETVQAPHDMGLSVTRLDASELAFAFENPGEPLQLAELSVAEMLETEGEAWPVVVRWGLPLVVKYGPRVFELARHGAHHTFRWIGKQPHLQLTTWVEGVKGSGRPLFRLPLGWRR
jgi:hypothetical protein